MAIDYASVADVKKILKSYSTEFDDRDTPGIDAEIGIAITDASQKARHLYQISEAPTLRLEALEPAATLKRC